MITFQKLARVKEDCRKNRCRTLVFDLGVLIYQPFFLLAAILVPFLSVVYVEKARFAEVHQRCNLECCLKSTPQDREVRAGRLSRAFFSRTMSHLNGDNVAVAMAAPLGTATIVVHYLVQNSSMDARYVLHIAPGAVCGKSVVDFRVADQSGKVL